MSPEEREHFKQKFEGFGTGNCPIMLTTQCQQSRLLKNLIKLFIRNLNQSCGYSLDGTMETFIMLKVSIVLALLWKK